MNKNFRNIQRNFYLNRINNIKNVHNQAAAFFQNIVPKRNENTNCRHEFVSLLDYFCKQLQLLNLKSL
jgi:hypothetical protein